MTVSVDREKADRHSSMTETAQMRTILEQERGIARIHVPSRYRDEATQNSGQHLVSSTATAPVAPAAPQPTGYTATAARQPWASSDPTSPVAPAARQSTAYMATAERQPSALSDPTVLVAPNTLHPTTYTVPAARKPSAPSDSTASMAPAARWPFAATRDFIRSCGPCRPSCLTAFEPDRICGPCGPRCPPER